jgi:hypothetical protein
MRLILAVLLLAVGLQLAFSVKKYPFRLLIVKTKEDEQKKSTTSENSEEDGAEAIHFHHSLKKRQRRIVDHNEETKNYHKTIYFLKNKSIKVVPDYETFTALGFQESDLETITEQEFSTYNYQFEAIPKVVKPSNMGPDEIIGMEIMKSKIFLGVQVHDPVEIGEYINPAILPFKNRLLVATGMAWGQHDKIVANEHIAFRWFNHSIAPFRSSGQLKPAELRDPSYPNADDTYYLGVNEQHIDELEEKMVGQDPRMVAIDEDEAYIVFTYRFSKHISMGVCMIVHNKTRDRITGPNFVPVIGHDEGPHTDQKNWSPFLLPSPAGRPAHAHAHRQLQHHSSPASPSAYLNEDHRDLFLVQQINPLVVYRVRYSSLRLPVPDLTRNYLKAELVSRSPHQHIVWPYGHLRGGSNAVYLAAEDVFLSLFHSSAHLPGNPYTTYIFGAYTFSVDAPFRLLAYTPFPLMDETFYTGPWNPLKNRHIDFDVFPMSCFLREVNGLRQLFVSFGHQDTRGYIGRIPLGELLQNLVPVGWEQEGEADGEAKSQAER